MSLLAGFQWKISKKKKKTSVRWMKTALSLVFTDTDYLKYLFPQFVKSNLYHICYTAIGQRISICNYWNGETPRNNLLTLYYLLTVFRTFTDWLFVLCSPPSDPHHRDLYVNSSDYLALLNSERANPNSTGQHILCG